MAVLENLEIGATPIHRRFREQLEKALDALPLVRAMLGKRAATLSGGQRQLGALGRPRAESPGRGLRIDQADQRPRRVDSDGRAAGAPMPGGLGLWLCLRTG